MLDLILKFKLSFCFWWKKMKLIQICVLIKNNPDAFKNVFLVLHNFYGFYTITQKCSFKHKNIFYK